MQILSTCVLEARNPWGMLREQAQSNEALARTQLCVCFTETPLEHTWMLCKEIENRDHQFGLYGVAFTKLWARGQGVYPVWYVDITPGHDWLMVPINELADIALSGEALAYVVDDKRQRVIRQDGTQELQRVPVEESQLARIAPFVEQMGTGEMYRKEFW